MVVNNDSDCLVCYQFPRHDSTLSGRFSSRPTSPSLFIPPRTQNRSLPVHNERRPQKGQGVGRRRWLVPSTQEKGNSHVRSFSRSRRPGRQGGGLDQGRRGQSFNHFAVSRTYAVFVRTSSKLSSHYPDRHLFFIELSADSDSRSSKRKPSSGKCSSIAASTSAKQTRSPN